MIVAGFGFRASATADSLQNALRRAAPGAAVGLLAAPSDKAGTDAFHAFAEALALPVAPVDQEALMMAQTPTQSAASAAARGTGSVAEAAALCAAGPGARLLAPRVISDDRLATCALAQTKEGVST